MRHLRRFLCPEFIFGSGARLLAGRYAANLGAVRPLVVSDAGVKAAGWTADVLSSLRAEGLSAVLFDGATPNPKAHEVMAGAAMHVDAQCDVIVAVGGGSVIDCAKGIGVVLANGGHILDFAGIDNVPAPGPPLICIPTTAGSSSDLSQFAVIMDTERGAKVAIMSKAMVPDVSLIDPTTTLTCDRTLTANTGLDALAHALEAYVSRASSSMADLHALEAMRLVRQTLPRAIAAPTDEKTREIMMRASMHAGLSFSNASLGAIHAMGHPLTGTFGIPHGEANALLLEHVVGFNFDYAHERYLHIAAAFGLNVDGLGVARELAALQADIVALKREVGIVGGLAERGVTRAAIGAMAESAAADLCLVTNPRPANRHDLEALYEQAL